MINIFVYGLDQFVVGDLSERMTEVLSKVFEVKKEDINFIAPNDMIFHDGVEQTSWRVIVEVKLPEEFEYLELQAKEIILHYVSEVAVHVEVTFLYYGRKHHYASINKDYPLYLTEERNPSHLVTDSYNEDDELVEGEGDDEIYTDDIFAGIVG